MGRHGGRSPPTRGRNRNESSLGLNPKQSSPGIYARFRDAGVLRGFAMFILFRCGSSQIPGGLYVSSKTITKYFRQSRSAGISRTAQMIMMRYSPALMSIFALFGAISGKADDNLPSHFNFDRYSAMVDHSPFAIATAVALPAATPDFAKDLYVANAAHSPEGDMVTIASSSDRISRNILLPESPWTATESRALNGQSVRRLKSDH